MFVVSFDGDGLVREEVIFELIADATRFAAMKAQEGKRPTLRRLRVNVYVLDREHGGRVIAARGVLVDRGLGWAREYFGVDAKRSILIQPTSADMKKNDKSSIKKVS